MIRRLMLLATLSVLVGVFVLSAPVLAGNSAQPGKVTIGTTTGKPAVVQTSPSKAVASIQPSTRSIVVGAFRYYLRNWFGWPYIQIFDPKQSVPDGPQMSGTDPAKRPRVKVDITAVRDNGGSTDDF
jgi:hypothetical protein